MSGSNKKSISQQLKILEESLSWFESDDFKLEEAVKKYEESAKIADELEASLQEVKNKIEIIKQDFQA